MKHNEEKWKQNIQKNIIKLSEGTEVGNYRELCRILEIDITGGNSRQVQLKELERLLELS